MKTLAVAATLALIISSGCSWHPVQGSTHEVDARAIDLGTVEVPDRSYQLYTLSGDRECRISLHGLADNQVLVQAVVLGSDSQGHTQILARPKTVAPEGQKVTLDIGHGSLTLTPKLKPAG